MGTNCAHLVSGVFCFVMLSLSDNNQTDIIEDLNSISRYLDDLLKVTAHTWAIFFSKK